MRLIEFGKWQLAIVSQGLWSGTTFLVAIYLARHLSIEEFGGYAIVMAGKLFCISILGAVLITPLTVICGQTTDQILRQETLQGAIAALQIALAVLIIPIVSLALWRWGQLAFSSSIFVMGGVIVELQRRINFIQDATHRDFWGGAWTLGGSLALLAALKWVDHFNLSNVLTSLGLIGLIWAIRSDWAHWVSVPPIKCLTVLKEFWRIGRWGIGSNLLGYVYSQASTFLTLGLIGVSGVATLELSRQLVAFVQIIMSGMANLWHPKLALIAKKDLPGLFIREIWKVTRIQTLVGTILVVASALASPFILPLVVPGKEQTYSMVPTVAWILGCAVVFQLLWQHPSFGVIALGKPNYGFLTKMTAAGLSIPVGYVLTSAFGVVGAAWSRVLAELLIFSVSVLAMYRVANLRANTRMHLLQDLPAQRR